MTAPVDRPLEEWAVSRALFPTRLIQERCAQKMGLIRQKPKLKETQKKPKRSALPNEYIKGDRGPRGPTPSIPSGARHPRATPRSRPKPPPKRRHAGGATAAGTGSPRSIFALVR